MLLLNTFLSGKKSYLTALFMIGIGVAQAIGFEIPGFDANASGQLIMEGIGVIALRAGIGKGAK